jgi:putative Mn2+ efflux pump MntP
MISLELIAVAVALGCDAFSVAIGVGALGLTGRRIFRLAWHFGLFQFFMPLIGLVIGNYSAAILGTAGKWVAAVCLAVIGFNMLRGAFKTGDKSRRRGDPTRGWSLVVLSFSTSVDALITGFSLGLMGVNILIACIVIGVTASLMTIIGMLIGAGAAYAIGRRAEAFGGIVLMLLAAFFILR